MKFKTLSFFISVIFLLLSTKTSFADEKIDVLLKWQEAFVNVAKKVEPSVVCISTKGEVVASPFFDDRFFRDFFGDFFGRSFEFPKRKRPVRGLGSGIVIDERGYILTNEHVVARAKEIKVTFPDGKEFDGKIVGTDPTSDIAVIKIDLQGYKIKPATLGDSDKIRVGEWVIAIGNPFAYQLSEQRGKATAEPTVTVGVISALKRSVAIKDRLYVDLVQTDAAINPGNSG